MNIVCPYTLNSTIFTYTVSFNQSGMEFWLVLFVFGFFFLVGCLFFNEWVFLFVFCLFVCFAYGIFQ